MGLIEAETKKMNTVNKQRNAETLYSSMFHHVCIQNNSYNSSQLLSILIV